MPHLLRLASRLYNTPLLVLPSTAEVFATVLSSRAGEAALLDEAAFQAAVAEVEQRLEGRAPSASRFVGRSVGADGGARPYKVQDGVAVISVVGELVNRGAWVGASSGLVSYEGVQAQLRAAASDPEVRAVLLDMASPGGEAVGAMETGEAVRALAAQKPVTAVVNGMAASAGYAIPSGATSIVTTPTGVNGSIGVVMLHVDRSEANAKAGLKPTLIFSGAHKVDGNGLGPLPDEVLADLQAGCDGFYDQFVDCVAAGRPGLTPEAVRATEARTFIGQKAVDAGLADSVGGFDQAFADLSRSASRRTSAPAPKGPQRMSDDSTTVNAADEQKKGATAQRDRIRAITTCDEAKGRDASAQHLAYETDMSAEDAKKLLATMPKGAATVAETMAARDAPDLGAGGGAPDAAAQAKTMDPDAIYAARAKAGRTAR